MVCFSDGGLGGTARSAILAANAWAAAGFDVVLCPLDGIHPKRQGLVSDDILTVGWEQVALERVSLVHYHHGVSTKESEDRFGSLARAFNERRSVAPAMLVNSIFAEPLNAYALWSGVLVVGVLGPWARMQLNYRSPLLRRRARVVVIPNPQPFAFFREPSDAERTRARANFGFMRDQQVILRVGSPIDGKWSADYLRLAACLPRNSVLVGVGVPQGLRQRFPRSDSIRILESLDDDERLRDLYWAADISAVSADQGESFGNVIMEALGCGLPVVYRTRPTRDNTPHDFQFIPGFTVARGFGDWRSQVLAGRRAEAAVSRDDWRDVFSLDGVSRALAATALPKGGNNNQSWAPVGVSALDKLRCAVRHNPVSFRLIRTLRLIRYMRRRRNRSATH